ncbi:MAG TPA: sigma-54-dependent Fis family transcriptional regulator [Pseudomonadaceae bacterium]|nr:sigma-54-dependent Fis family transcriptional regulator [Pseudomonadaceae bacterium]
MARVLLVDDDDAFTSATAQLLTLLDHKVSSADSVAAAAPLLQSERYDRVFLDLMLPDGSGLQLLDHISDDSTRVTIITGHPAVKAQVMNLYGTNVNYLIKPITLDQLKRLFDDGEATTGESAGKGSGKRHFGGLIGESAPMKALYSMIERVASSSVNVLLLGESGVGKEVVAKAIHKASQVPGPFVPANCGAFSSELIGSELFGHEKGAFTGAIARKSGLFEQAENGTLFLDEITEMPIGLQPNLLRALESRMLTRVGASAQIPINCRVISATNRSEQQLVENNCLREDLYYRLAVFPIHIPPLRERMDDLPLLAQSFVDLLNRENDTGYSIAAADMARLMAYDWPGNVRELRHSIHRAYIMTSPDAEYLSVPASFTSPFSRKESSQPQPKQMVGRTIEDVERELIVATLKQFDNNKTRAAEVLGVSVKTLYNRLGTYEATDAQQN